MDADQNASNRPLAGDRGAALDDDRVAAIRRDFPILARRVHDRPLNYLDSAASGQMPEPVMAAVDDYRKKHAA